VVAVVLLGGVTSCGRGKGDHDLTADIQRRTSALTELARTGWTVVANPVGTGAELAASAIDGNPATRWNSVVNQAPPAVTTPPTPPQSFQVDMQSAQSFNEIILDSGNSTSTYPATYTAYVSNDGVDWGSPVATGNGATQAVSIRFTTKTARFIKITQTGTKSFPWTLHELRVYQSAQPCDSCTASDGCHLATCDAAARTNYSRDGLMGLWHLDGDGRDASDNGNHFTISGVTTDHGVDGADLVWGPSGSLSQANTVGGIDPTPMPGISFVAWVKPTGPCPGSWHLYERTTQIGFQLSCTGTGTPGLSAAFNLGSGYTWSAPVGSVPLDTWSLVAMTWDKHNVRFYINGLDVGGSQKEGSLVGVAPFGTYLGAPSVGAMDEAALYGKGLDAPAIQAIGLGPQNLCKADNPKCVAADSCHYVDCVAGECQAPAAYDDEHECDDGQACTQNTTCKSGVCGGGTTMSCNALGVCEEATCDPLYKPIPPQDINAQWHLDGDGVDASGHGTTFPPVAGLTAAVGKFGQGMHYDNAACPLISVTPNSAVNSPLGMTFATWVKPDDNFCPSTATRVLWQRGNEIALGLKCRSDNTIAVTDLLNTNGGWGWANPAGTLAPGQWSHVAMVYSRSRLDLYVNGLFIGGFSVGNNMDIWHQTGWMTLGCQAQATMDEATLYRRAFSQVEVAALYRSPTQCNVHPKVCQPGDTCHSPVACDPVNGCPAPEAFPPRPLNSDCSDGNACTVGDKCSATGACVPGTTQTPPCGPGDQCTMAGACDDKAVVKPPADGLVGWWPFEGDSKDATANHIDLTNKNAQLVGGKLGTAYYFDGTACLSSPHWGYPQLDMTGGAGFTTMAWVKTSSTLTCPSGYNEVVSRGGDWGMPTMCGTGGTSPGLTGSIAGPGAPGDSYGGVVGVVPSTSWTHLAMTWDHSNIKFYVNGVYKGSVARSTASLAASEPSLNIGCLVRNYFYPNGVYFYKGAIDEVALYNRALEQWEITDYIARTNANTCKYEPKDEGTLCDDGNGCTNGDTCRGGHCTPGTPTVCEALNQCHVPGVCDPSNGDCSNPPIEEDTPCDDGDLCTTGEMCHDGQCWGGQEVVCAGGDQCQQARTCDPSTGACTALPLDEGSPCDDGDNCTVGDSCRNGACTPGTAVTCTAADSCHLAGTCDQTSGACSHPIAAVCLVPDPHGGGGLAEFDFEMQPHFPGMDVPPAIPTPSCPAPLHRPCATAARVPGCEAIVGYVNDPNDPHKTKAEWGQCTPVQCDAGTVASCQTSCGTTGLRTCLADRTWEPCKDVEWCNGLDDSCTGNPYPATPLPACLPSDLKRSCNDSTGAPGCQEKTGFDPNPPDPNKIAFEWGDCVAPHCTPDVVNSCTTPWGSTGFHKCLPDGTWQPCQDLGEVDEGGVCQIPVSAWDPDHGRGFDTWLDGCDSRPVPGTTITGYTWDVQKPGSSGPVPGDCRIKATFPSEGTYTVVFGVVLSNGQTMSSTRNIPITNRVIASLGDSMASGEGNPDIEAPDSYFGTAVWRSKVCHRSLKSWHALAARKIEDDDPHTSVTFMSLACSGGGIYTGLLREYAGQEPGPGTPKQRPQLQEAHRIFSAMPDRPLDALFLQIGANDAGFSHRVTECAYPSITAPDPTDSLDEALRFAEIAGIPGGTEVMAAFAAAGNPDLTAGFCEDQPAVHDELAKLERFHCLNRLIRGENGGEPCLSEGLSFDPSLFKLNVSPERIYIGEYPDLTHRSANTFCDGIRLEGAIDDHVIDMIPDLKGSVAARVVPTPILHAIQLLDDTAGSSVVAQILEAFVKDKHDGVISREEVEWAYDNVIVPLNTKIKVMAISPEFNWTYVSGINDVQRMGSHGYCAPIPWVRHWDESKRVEGVYHGVLHPNVAGHRDAYFPLLYDAVARELRTRAKPTCTSDADCSFGIPCRSYFPDADHDGFGKGTPVRRCDSTPDVPPLYVEAAVANDCCDTDSGAHPGAPTFHPTANACGNFDWNCDGVVETKAIACIDGQHPPLVCGHICLGNGSMPINQITQDCR
jgi:hypothetical protein